MPSIQLIVRREIAARPAQQRDIEILNGLHDVFAVAVLVGQRGTFLEEAALDAAAEMLGEVAVNLRIDIADPAIGIDFDACLQGFGLSRAEERDGESGGEAAA